MATDDLKWDLSRGFAWLLPPADMAYALWFAGTPMGRVYAAQHGPVPGIENPPSHPYKPHPPEPADLSGPEPWVTREHTTWAPAMHETTDPAGVELRRLSGLEEGPPPGAMDGPAGAEFAELYHGVVGDRRRYTQAYSVGAAAARKAVEEDEAARDLGGWSVPSEDIVPPFGPAFDISPAT